ncbi:MAG: DUF3500 domain-containing protein [Acidobacteria bacterium]|nr:MAG: DUF3500 domain-containing protein [Acidobacteriota bacterium]
MLRFSFGMFVLVLLLGALLFSADREDMTAVANRFLALLSPAQQDSALFPAQDAERYNWHYTAKARKGVPFRELDTEQAAAGDALIGAVLSEDGHRKARAIMHLDQILYDQEGRNPIRDAQGYFFSFFGRPGKSGEWALRLEGHHLSLNLTMREGKIVGVTPLFFGANPAIVRRGPEQGMQVLRQEEELARQLLLSLDSSGRATAVIESRAPADIITRASRRPEIGAAVGLPYASMNPAQQSVLIQLLRVYIDRLSPSQAEAEMALIKQDGLERLYFAWAGEDQPGKPHYYRVQGPSFVIEYDNTQNSANHIHTSWRSFKRDFGGDPLRSHYERDHSHQHAD